jgi:predicted phosphodiesterase
MRRFIKLVVLMTLLATTGIASAQAQVLEQKEPFFHFAILSDRTGGANQKAFEAVVRDIARLGPDFVVTVGDLVEDGSRQERWVEPLKTLEQINVPIYFTPGNHDIHDEVSAGNFRQKTGFEPYHSFDAFNTHFVVFNNASANSWPDIKEKQRQWLEKDLAEHANAQNLYVLMHKPFWVKGVGEGKPDPMHELFKKYGVDAVFTGHHHQNGYEEIDGIQYHIAGSSGGLIDFGEIVDLGFFYQFLWCTVRGDQLQVSIVKSGSIFDADLVSLSEHKLTWRIMWELVGSLGELIGNEAKVTFSIKNETDKPIVQTIRIEPVPNWKASELAIPFVVEPGRTFETTALMKNTGEFFPFPKMKVTYPFGNGKQFAYEAPVTIRRSLEAPKLPVAPEVDGKLEPGEWTDAQAIDTFADFDGNKTKADPTKVYLAHDETYLYLAVRCDEPQMDQLKAAKKERDSMVWSDDAFGVMIAPTPDTIYKFYINSLGTIWDERIDVPNDREDEGWNGNFEIKTAQNADHWLLELKIPLAGLELEPGDTPIRINIRRKQQTVYRNAVLTPFWNHVPASFGVMRLK